MKQPSQIATLLALASLATLSILAARSAVAEPIDPEIETALQGAFEGACEFKFVALQRHEPDDATER